MVVAHVAVGRLERDLEAGAGRQGARLEAVAHQAQDLLHPCPRGGADHVVGGHVGRDDVGGLPAPGDDAVHAVAGLELLAQQADGRLGHDHRVSRVDALPGEARGVRLATQVGDGQLLHGDEGRLGDVLRPGMDHERRVDVTKQPRLDEGDLAATTLLGRCAQHAHAQAEALRDRRQGQAGPERGGADDVVAAGVPDTRQGVVLRADGHVERTRSAAADDGGGQAGHAPLHPEPGLLESLGQPGRGVVLLVADLRVGVDAVRELDEARSGRLQRRSRLGRGVGVHARESRPPGPV